MKASTLSSMIPALPGLEALLLDYFTFTSMVKRIKIKIYFCEILCLMLVGSVFDKKLPGQPFHPAKI